MAIVSRKLALPDDPIFKRGLTITLSPRSRRSTKKVTEENEEDTSKSKEVENEIPKNEKDT